MNTNPIGVLDSGVGGLTVLSAIVRELPNESFIYIGDSKNTPYGVKSQDEIYNLSKKLIRFLLEKQVKLIVIACNTITVSCLDRLRSDFPSMPIVGTVPVIKTAAAVSQKKRIGILSTTRTAQSDYQKHLIEEFASHCQVFNHGTDDLVPLIEEGKEVTEEMTTRLKKTLTVFSQEDIDTLVLGCTHFPFLKEQMKHILGNSILLLDSGDAIARQVRRVLEHNETLRTEGEGKVALYTTGNIKITQHLAQVALGNTGVTVKEVRLSDDN